MGFERTLSGTKDIRTSTAQHVANEAAAVSCAAHDLLYGSPILCQSKNGGIGLFAAEVAFILNPLGSGKQAGIDRCGSDRGTDLPHRFPNGIKKGATGVLHEVPAVGNLNGVRERFGHGQRIAAATVAGDYSALWLAPEPCVLGCWFAVWQQRNGLAPLKVANNRSVALVSPPRPVIDPHDGWRCKGSAPVPSDDTKKGVVAHRKHQPASEACRR